jgi:hypothetical protein
MQKTRIVFAILTAIIVIVILIEPMEQGATVRAQTFFAEINSPKGYQEKMYTTSSVNISVLISIVTLYSGPFDKIFYSLDGKQNESLSLSFSNVDRIPKETLGTGTLNNLTDGYHRLVIYYGYVGYESYATSTPTTIFLVNATGFHTPQLLSPLSTTYTKNKVPLTYTCDENRYSVYYNFNNSGYMVITSNTTLSGLADGRYAISIKAMNGDIIYSQQQITVFNVNTTKINVSEFDDIRALILVGVVSAVAVFLVVAIVIYRRRKISRGNF